jgi:hypothetical protein
MLARAQSLNVALIGVLMGHNVFGERVSTFPDHALIWQPDIILGKRRGRGFRPEQIIELGQL